MILLIFLISCSYETGSEVTDVVLETEIVDPLDRDTETNKNTVVTLDSEIVTGKEDPWADSFELPAKNWVIVEWGDFIELQADDYEDEDKYVGVAVNFVKTFESTFRDYNRSIPQGRQLRMEFVDEKIRADITENYDDIILVPSILCEQIPNSGTALVTLSSDSLYCRSIGLVEFWEVSSKYDEVLWAYTIIENRIVIPDEFEPIKNDGPLYGFSDFLTWSFGQANEYLIELGLADNLFRDGMTVEELEEYFELVTDSDTFAPLFED